MGSPANSAPDDRWRRVLFWFSGAAAATFLINLAFVIYVARRPRDGADGEAAILLDHQSCATVKSLSTGLHVLINVLSAILLAGSNYCMQCVVAPTRAQVDAAHRTGKWLDIGIPSVRNLRRIGWVNLGFWLFLALSSIPLHLFYNSTIATSTSINFYLPFVADDNILASYLNGTPYDFESLIAKDRWKWWRLDQYLSQAGRDALFRQYVNGELTKLTASDCISAYGASFQSRWSDLILVTKENFTDSDLPYGYTGLLHPRGGCGTYLPSQWVCRQFVPDGLDGPCPPHCEKMLDVVLPNAEQSGWAPFGVTVDHCLARQVPENCRLLVNIPFSITVVLINFTKMVAMFLWAWKVSGTPLLTIGDAVASFLKTQDETTAGMCLKSRRDFAWSHRSWNVLSQQFDGRRRRRFVAISGDTWLLSTILFLAAIGLCMYFLGVGITGLSNYNGSGGQLFGNVGFGTPDSETMLDHDSISALLVVQIAIANLPQLIMTFTYVVYDGLLTSICLASEYTDFASDRKSLRVSSQPVGAQRSAYFLQLPLRFSVPLVITSALVHWLLSQSLYLIVLNPQYSESMLRTWAPDGLQWYNPATTSFPTLGWWPLGVILIAVAGILMQGFLIVLGSFRFKTAMPVVGSCSAAISAACHLDREEVAPWEKEVKWGVTTDGHCSFSSLPVTEPVKGEIYI